MTTINVHKTQGQSETSRNSNQLPRVEGRCRHHDGIELKRPKGEKGKGFTILGVHQPLPSRQKKVGNTRIEPGQKYQVKFDPPITLPDKFGDDDRFLCEAELVAYESQGEVRLGFPPVKGKLPRAGWRLSAFSQVRPAK